MIQAVQRFSRSIWSFYQLSIRNLIRFQDRLGLTPEPWLKHSRPHLRQQSSPAREILVSFLCLSPQKQPEDFDLPRQSSPAWEWLPFKDLPAARGQWIVVLEDDEKPAACLVDALRSAHSEADIVYWDISVLQDGRQAPWYKPGWSPELLLSAPLLRGCALRKGFLIDRAGLLFNQADNSWQGVLAAALEPNTRVAHLPQFLSHHSQPLTAQDYLPRAAKIARKRLHPEAASSLETNGAIRHTWPPRQELVSIIIPTRDRYPLLRRCISSLLEKTSYQDYKIFLVDDHSRDPDLLAWYAELSSHPKIKILENPEPFNYSAVNNFGARNSQGNLLLFLNNDVEIIEPGWLEEMLRWAQLPHIGVVGAQLLYPDRTIQHNGIVLGLGGHAGHIFQGLPAGSDTLFGSTDWYRNVSAVTGACLMMRRVVFEQCRGFDEDYQLVFSDVEICLQALRAGYRNLVTPFARLIHYEGQSRDRTLPPRDVRRGCEQLLPWIQPGDPYFHPGLSHAVNNPTPRRWFEPDPLDRLQQIKHFLT